MLQLQLQWTVKYVTFASRCFVETPSLSPEQWQNSGCIKTALFGLRTLSQVLIVSHWSLTDDCLLTLKSQEEKTFIATFSDALRMWKLLPQALESLWLNNKVMVCKKKTRLWPIFPPVHQNDADGKEGGGDSEKIGCRYTVEHHLALAGRISGTAVGQGCTFSDKEVGVVAIKHQALGKGALPEAMGRGVSERGSQKSSSAS